MVFKTDRNFIYRLCLLFCSRSMLCHAISWGAPASNFQLPASQPLLNQVRPGMPSRPKSPFLGLNFRLESSAYWLISRLSMIMLPKEWMEKMDCKAKYECKTSILVHRRHRSRGPTVVLLLNAFTHSVYASWRSQEYWSRVESQVKRSFFNKVFFNPRTTWFSWLLPKPFRFRSISEVHP